MKTEIIKAFIRQLVEGITEEIDMVEAIIDYKNE